METRRPFDPLARRRKIRKTLPSDLSDFYGEYEGIGLDQDAEFDGVRLCRLNEVKRASYYHFESANREAAVHLR